MPECGTTRRKTFKNVGIFKLPSRKNAEWRKWREEILNVILKYRVADKHFKEQLEKDRVHICERHFKPEEVNKGMRIYTVANDNNWRCVYVCISKDEDVCAGNLCGQTHT